MVTATRCKGWDEEEHWWDVWMENNDRRIMNGDVWSGEFSDCHHQGEVRRVLSCAVPLDCVSSELWWCPEQWLWTNIQFSDFSRGSTFCLDGISLGIWIYLDLLNRPGKQLQCHLEQSPYNFVNEEIWTQRGSHLSNITKLADVEDAWNKLEESKRAQLTFNREDFL